MLGPEIEGEVAQGGFGHNGLASAAGSTLTADAGVHRSSRLRELTLANVVMALRAINYATANEARLATR
jgi:hypothetical protein